MADLLFIRVQNVYPESINAVTVEYELRTQEGTTINDFSAQSGSVDIKTAGIYDTPTQVNDKIKNLADARAAELGHDKNWDMIYMNGAYVII